MSFGFGVGDFLAVGKLAWAVYKSCRDAPESFRNISLEVLSLHAVLKEVEEILTEEPPTGSRKQSLATVTNGCKCVLDDLKALVDKYEGMGSQSKITWDRMKWGANDLTELRARLTSNTVLLTAFMSTSQVVVEKQLKKLIREFQEGKHEGSIKTIATVDSLTLDDKETWRAIRKEFETIGISVAAFDANKGFIMGWFQQAFESGAFEECMVEDGENSISSRTSFSSDTLEIQQTSSENVVDYESKNSARVIPYKKVNEGVEQTGSASTYLPTTPNKPTRKPIPIRNLSGSGSPKTSPNQAGLAVDPRLKLKASEPPDSSSLLRSQDDMHVGSSVITEKQPRIATLFAWALRYDKAFHAACKGGNIAKVKLSLEKGADVDSFGPGYRTALQSASYRWQMYVVSCLLENGANVNLRYSGDPGYGTALHYAAEGDITTIRKGTKSGADICDLLLKHGAQLDAQTSVGTTPLGAASRQGHLDIVKTLLDHGADNVQGSPLADATFHVRPGVVRLLLDRQTWGETVKRQQVNLAFRQWSTNRELIWELDEIKSTSPLLLLLLEHGADPNLREEHRRSVLYFALERHLDRAAKLLVEHGAQVTTQDEFLFVKAAERRCKKALKAMRKRGADIEMKDSRGFTALDVAVCAEDLSTALLLVGYGAMNNSGRYLSPGNITQYRPGLSHENIYNGYQRLAALTPSKINVKVPGR